MNSLINVFKENFSNKKWIKSENLPVICSEDLRHITKSITIILDDNNQVDISKDKEIYFVFENHLHTDHIYNHEGNISQPCLFGNGLLQFNSSTLAPSVLDNIFHKSGFGIKLHMDEEFLFENEFDTFLLFPFSLSDVEDVPIRIYINYNEDADLVTIAWFI